MQKLKKIVNLVLAIAILISVFDGVIPRASAKEFTDVSRAALGEDVFDAINYVSDNGWIVGTSTTKFSPNSVVTRAMFATVLYRYSGSSEKVAPSFEDVPSGTWYYYAVGWAQKHNIVSGTSATKFSPNSALTREQILSILYRYATRYEKKTFSPASFRSITAHPDYSNISNYAVEAVRWAKTFHIIPTATVDSETYIYPKSALSRAYVSLYLAKYAVNVTGFRPSDRFGFANTPNNFSKNYVIGAYALNRFNYCINNYYRVTGGSEANASIDIQAVKGVLGTEWRGSCAGMTVSVLLDKIGKIDFDKNFGNNAATMSSVAKPKDYVSTIQSAINLYQLLQYTNLYDEYDGGDYIYGSSISKKMDYIYKYFKDYGCCPFSYYWKEGSEGKGHSVLLTDITYSSTENTYTLKVIDPNKIVTPRTTKITFSGGKATYTFADSVESIELTNVGALLKYDISLYDYFDLDGEYNSTDYTKINCAKNASEIWELDTASMNEETLETVTLTLPCTAFELANAEGETLNCNGGDMEGTLQVISQRLIPKGPDAPADLVLTVKKSDSYTYNNLSQGNTSFCVLSDDRFASASGDGIYSVTYNSNNNTLNVDGTDMTYSAWLWTKADNYTDFYISGKSDSAFQLVVENNTITTTGLSGAYVCGFSQANRLDVVETEVNLQEGALFDLSETKDGKVKVLNKGAADSGMVLNLLSLAQED